MTLEQLNNLLQTQHECGPDNSLDKEPADESSGSFLVVDKMIINDSGEDIIFVRWIDDDGETLLTLRYIWQHHCWHVMSTLDPTKEQL